MTDINNKPFDQISAVFDSYLEQQYIKKLPAMVNDDYIEPIYHKNQLIGHGYIKDDHLMVNDDYDIPIDQVELIINLSDQTMPSSFYRLK